MVNLKVYEAVTFCLGFTFRIQKTRKTAAYSLIEQARERELVTFSHAIVHYTLSKCDCTRRTILSVATGTDTDVEIQTELIGWSVTSMTVP